MSGDWTNHPGAVSRLQRFFGDRESSTETVHEATGAISGLPGEGDAKRIARRLAAAIGPGRRDPAEIEGLARSIVGRAQRAVRKLDGAPLGVLAAEEASALEAVVHVRGRPAVRVLGRDLEDISVFPDSDLWIALYDQHRKKVLTAANATAAVRVRDTLLPAMQWVQGTAVRIGDRLALTNRHVLIPANGGVRLARRVPGTTEARLKRSYELHLDFAFDGGPERANAFRVTGVPFIAGDDDPVDAAVLEIEPASATDEPAPPVLKITKDDVFDIDRLYVIGHPGRVKVVPAEIQLVFGDPDERKRVSFGMLMDPDDTDQVHIVHDASTFGGYSGGAVCGFAATDLQALHYWGDGVHGNRAIAARALHGHGTLGRLLKPA